MKEIEILENSVPKSIRSVNKWAMKIFADWRAGRKDKACEDKRGSAPEISQIQDLETNESLNVWATNFVMDAEEKGE